MSNLLELANLVNVDWMNDDPSHAVPVDTWLQTCALARLREIVQEGEV